MHIQVSRERIDAIKARVDFAALATERGLSLKRIGRHLYALCPFHNEKTPSFTISPQFGLFHCFGCGVSGDVIGFVMRFDRLRFPEAVRKLAARANVNLEDDASGGRASWR